jgi:hypothetical protein
MRLTILNIGSQSIKYVAFQNGSATAWGTEPLSGAVKNGLILEPAVTGQQIKALFASGKLPREKVIYTLNGLPFSYRFFTIPELDPASVDEAITRMARQEMPLVPEDMYLAWRAYPAAKDQRQFLVTGVARRPVDALIQTSTEAGIKPARLYLPHLALAALADENSAVIIDFEADYSNLTLVVDGVPVGMHTVPAAGAGPSVLDTAGQLGRELTRMTGFYNDNHPGNPLPESIKIWLTGESFGDAEVLKRIRENSGYPVESLKPPAGALNIPLDMPLAAYAVNAGAAILEKTSPAANESDYSCEIDLANIVAGRTKIKKPTVTWKKWLPWAVITLGIIALAAAYVSHGQAEAQITSLKTGLQHYKQELTLRQDAASQAQQTLDSINRMLATTQQLKTENQNVSNPRDAVSDVKLLTQSLPPATTFGAITFSPAQISISGTATIQERVVEYVRTLEASRRFTSVSIIGIDRAVTGVSFLITIVR